MKQAGTKKRQVWRPKDKPDESGRSAHACMVCFLPNKFMAPANQIVQEEILPDMDEAEQFELMAQLMLAKQATFDKLAKNRHMRPPDLVLDVPLQQGEDFLQLCLIFL
jgi:hypothetical protein